MTIDTIFNDFRDKVCEQVQLKQEGVERYRVFTPFLFEDGTTWPSFSGGKIRSGCCPMKVIPTYTSPTISMRRISKKVTGKKLLPMHSRCSK